LSGKNRISKLDEIKLKVKEELKGKKKMRRSPSEDILIRFA
jgi:hypothetical protein